MTDVFDPWETKRGLLGVEYLSDVTEELRFGFAVYEYIVDVYFAYFVTQGLGESDDTLL